MFDFSLRFFWDGPLMAIIYPIQVRRVFFLCSSRSKNRKIKHSAEKRIKRAQPKIETTLLAPRTLKAMVIFLWGIFRRGGHYNVYRYKWGTQEGELARVRRNAKNH